MPFKRRRPELIITQDVHVKLEQISKSRTESAIRIERAKIILEYAKGETVSSIARMLSINRPKAERCVDKALQLGALPALDDLPRSGKPPAITPEAKTWLVNLACQKPKELGYLFESWTNRLLAKHARDNCEKKGHPSLLKINSGTVSKILKKHQRTSMNLFESEEKPTYKELEQRVKALEKEAAERTAALTESNQQMMFEIWERKKAAEALAESEEKFRSLAGKNEELLWEADTKGILTDVNTRSHESYGVALEEYVGRPIFDFLPPDEAKRFLRTYKQAVASRERISGMETVLFTKDGRLTNLKIWAFPFSSAEGKLLGFRGLLIDTTSRKKAQEVLRQSEERFSLALEATKDGIWDWDSKNKRVYTSKCFKELTGYKDDSNVEIEDWASNIHPDHCQKLIEVMQGRFFKKGWYDMDYLYRRPGEEEYRWYNIRGKQFYDEKGKAYRMVGAIRDINERKLAEEAIKKRETELEIKSASLEQSNIALKVLLQQREKDREELEQKVLANVKEMVLPFVEELKKTLSKDKEKTLLGIVESNLNEVISPFLRQLTSKYSVLTPKEIQIANLVKRGKTSKEIGQLLNTSKFTVDKHRRRLRRKLSLVHTKGNLRTHLLSLK